MVLKLLASLRRAAGCCAEPLRQLGLQKWAHTFEHQLIPQATALLMKVMLLAAAVTCTLLSRD